MKIRVRLTISAVAFALVAIVVCEALLYTSAYTATMVDRRGKIVGDLTDAYQLEDLTDEYVQYQEERPKIQWDLTWHALSTHLAQLNLEDPTEQATLDRIRSGAQNARDIFSELVVSFETLGTAPRITEYRQILRTRLSVELSSMVSDLTFLSDATGRKVLSSVQTSTLMVLVFSGVIVGIVVVNSFLTINTIGKPLTKLHEGTEIVGEGNLDHRVGTTAQDEIGQLSRAFDHMTENLKRTEEQLLKSERLAAIGETAAMVGHDLRNPLQGIMGAIYILKKSLGPTMDDTAREAIDLVEEDVERSNRIISDLLDYSREIKLEPSETTPRSLIRNALPHIGREIPSNIRLLDSAKDEPVMIADSRKMQRVLVNLIGNAIDAMPQGGTLSVSSSAEDGRVGISVADTGTGMTEEVMQKLWTPLFTTKHEGMGLGLPICKRIVEAHGGSISVQSILGKGSTFTVKLPTKPVLKRSG
jgi:signal transduction histidine kinase